MHMLQIMKCSFVSGGATMPPMIKNKTKYPNNLRRLRLAAKLTQSDIGKVWGVERGDVSRIEDGKVSITPHKLKLLTKHFKWSASQILDEGNNLTSMVPVLGYVGAGAEVFPVDDHAQGASLEEVECPAGYQPEGIVALRVKGDSMDPAIEDGDLIFYKREADGVPADCIGKKCIVKMENDGVLVKRVMKGSKPGHYHLMSINKKSDPIVDAKLVWASRVIDIRPY